MGYNFNQQLDNVGNYDIVFLDYNNGSDDIVRNAALLQEVITLVNAEKPINSTERNVVLGISMGGLVARYALAKMTKANIPTQTRLLITHDSPHHGANVPISLQLLTLELGNIDMFGYKIKDVLPEYNEAKNLLNATATTQLLKYRAYENTIQLPFGSIMIPTITANTFIDNIYRPMVTFLNTNPQPSYRFIATSQGAECGVPLFSPGAQLLNIEANASALFNFGLATGKAKVDIKAYAIPAVGSTAELLKINVYAKGYLFGFIRVVNDFYKNTMKVNSSTLLPIDGATGGTSPIGSVSIPQQQTSSMGIWGPLFGVYNAKLSTASLSNFCFVPTASALDVQNFNVESLTLPYVNGISLANPSKAVNYITQKSPTGGGGGTFNESHTRFTAINSNWLFNEMQNISNNTLNCSSACNMPLGTVKIDGPDQACNTATYTIPNLPNSVSISWSVSGNANITGPMNSRQVAITYTQSGSAILTALLTSSCGSISVSKTISTGSLPIRPTFFPGGSIPGTITYFGSNALMANVCATVTRNTVVLDMGDALNIQAFALVGSAITPFVSSTGIYNTITFTYPLTTSSISLKVEYDVPPCGEHFSYIMTLLNNCNTSATYKVFPNSANTTLNITPTPYTDGNALRTSSVIDNSNNAIQNIVSAPFEIMLYDDKGKLITQQKNEVGNKDITIDTQNLPNGTYFLHILDGKEVIKKQIIIQH